jgi:hypothetical protein
MGIPSDRRFLAVASKHLRHLFPSIPAQPRYFKRRRRLADTLEWLMSVFASQSPGFYDDMLLVDSSPVECARSRETVKRSALASETAVASASGTGCTFSAPRGVLACSDVPGAPQRHGPHCASSDRARCVACGGLFGGIVRRELSA